MIAIKSNKDLMFPPSFKGTVTMKMDLIQNKPDQQVYEIRITDTCTKEVEEEIEVSVDTDGENQTQTQTQLVTKQFGKEQVRFKTMSYAELDALASELNIDLSDKTQLRENINELFRQGFLLVTQKECLEGRGIYFSEAQDWETVNP
ncbi:hypothetical protein KSK37_13370 [Kaistella sp. DKR-2]|uniref:hypothetical protein n=1 Tax=Kaistella soli TaxID=2849654 RepID=UPI001C26CBF3|nr:hypothetical protein [Kaistella soli]MBU8884078.1 hypothetical protein [Kaistella soli]